MNEAWRGAAASPTSLSTIQSIHHLIVGELMELKGRAAEFNFVSLLCLFFDWWVMGGGTANGSAKRRKQRQKQWNKINEAERKERKWIDCGLTWAEFVEWNVSGMKQNSGSIPSINERSTKLPAAARQAHQPLQQSKRKWNLLCGGWLNGKGLGGAKQITFFFHSTNQFN